jgi:predicted esterase
MSLPETIEELLTKINQAFQQGDYEAVIAMTSQHTEEYPEQKPMLVYLQICAAARLGQYNQVYQVLEEAIRQGCWYSERALRESPSLRPLEGLSEYEQLIAISIKAAAEEKASSEKIVVVEPDTKSDAYPVLFVLHSNGSSAKEASSHWHSLVEKGWLLALPQAPNALWKGSYNWEDGEETLQLLIDKYHQINQTHRLITDQVIMGGHSMGGKLAVELALRGKIPCRGFLVYAPYISEEDLTAWEPLIEKINKERFKGVLLFGELDETIPHNSIYRLAELLEVQGVEVLVQHIEGLGHEFGAPIQMALERSIDFILS